ncbi:MAG: DUF1810 domain-containing protein [Prevotella sp.]|nr:DUF1810 domain-containing protein [Prevotella sp.]
MRKEKESTVQLKESTVVVKPKGKCAEFAVKIAGPMVIDGDGKPRDAYKPVLHAAYKGLQRFIEAQDKWNTYDKALEEVKNGKKETHWIWFIFPKLYGLGESEKSQFYGLDGREEAKAYIENDTLRTRLVEISEAVLNNEKSVYEIFGNDAIKVRSCILLFASVSDIPVFKQIKSKYRW